MTDETKPPTMAEVYAEAHKFITACRASTTARVRVSEDGLRVAADSTAGTCIVHVSMLEELADVALDLLGDAPRSEVSVLPGTLTDAARAERRRADIIEEALRAGNAFACAGDELARTKAWMRAADVERKARAAGIDLGAHVAPLAAFYAWSCQLLEALEAESDRAEEAERERDAAKAIADACADLSTTGKACDAAARAYDAAKGDARAEARATWDAACQAYTDARAKLAALGVTL